MLSQLKKRFPGMYAYYQHIQRRFTIIRINRIKRLPESQYPILDAKMYSKRIGHVLDWNNLVTYTEKMQWEKLFDKNPLKSMLADKYRVREWVKEKIGDDYLIPLIGTWDAFNSIDFSLLPEQFVLKTNHGSGTNLIVKDKNKLNIARAKRLFDDWLDIDYAFYTGFEMHYSDIKPMILAEKYLETQYGELQDYKFLCFDGKPYYCWVDMGRYSKHTRNVYDLDWNLQPWNQASYGVYPEPLDKPKKFEKMIEIATVLSQGFSHVRVDLYNVDGKIYFGEMTFTNGSGMDPIVPQQYDKMLGDLWHFG